MSFVPISVEKYVTLHLASNPAEDPAQLRTSLRDCVAAALAGAHCRCGEPIWVMGSVFSGHACFTCITGEAVPSEDYEIDQILAARKAEQRNPADAKQRRG
jgi:hypothetical protein